MEFQSEKLQHSKQAYLKTSLNSSISASGLTSRRPVPFVGPHLLSLFFMGGSDTEPYFSGNLLEDCTVSKGPGEEGEDVTVVEFGPLASSL